MYIIRDVVPLSLTNKRFQALSKSTLWRAKWFLQRYDRAELIFEAIARPKLFTEALFEQLNRLNAPLSRNIVQLLHVMREPVLRQQLLAEEQKLSLRRHMPDWGKNVTFPAYVAVLQHAVKLVSAASFEAA